MLCASVVSISNAQGGKTPPAKTTTVKTTPSPLKNVQDSASYAIGLSVINFYKTQGVTNINSTLVTRAMNDLLGGKKPLLDDATANAVLNNYMMTLQANKSKPNITAGENFLKQNKSKPGVKTTASGLQYEVLRDSAGAKPAVTDSVTVNYKGSLLNGTVFDNSYERGQPVTFSLNNVITGWKEGMQLMSVGSKFKFYIPYTLAYGPNDYGPIPGGSTLTFEVELLAIKKPVTQ